MATHTRTVTRTTTFNPRDARDDPLPPDPVLISLKPDTAVAGAAADFTLSCLGAGFTADSTIWFGDYEEPTTMVSDNEITTIVKPSLFVNPDIVPVKVRTGTVDSNALDFTFTAEPQSDVLSPDDARNLLRSGHRLRKRADPPELWFSSTVSRGERALLSPLTPEIEDDILSNELVLVS